MNEIRTPSEWIATGILALVLGFLLMPASILAAAIINELVFAIFSGSFVK